jgi:hypothetical protein
VIGSGSGPAMAGLNASCVSLTAVVADCPFRGPMCGSSPTIQVKLEKIHP